MTVAVLFLVEGVTSNGWVETVLPGLVTLIAAFAGAWFAFSLNLRREKEKDVQTNVDSANNAIFVLMRQWNEMAQLKRHLVDPVAADRHAWLSMAALLPRLYPNLRIDPAKLTYLLKSERPNLLNEIMIEEDRFFALVELINKRSELHLGVVQPALEALGVQDGAQVDIRDLQKAFGDRIVVQLKNLTRGIIEQLNENIASSKAISSQFHLVVKQIYPHSKIATFNALE